LTPIVPVLAATVGNALEWFDLAAYGFFAVPISKAFFPAADPTASLLLTLAAFAVSYLARPVGALVLGAYADRHGRKAALMISIWLMALGTLAIAITPTYASIGVIAPTCVVLARLIQGFSAGGEFGPGVALLFESSKRRGGLLASWMLASQALSTIMAAALGVALTRLLSPVDLQSWGWRVPFVIGLLIAPAGYWVRRHVHEPEQASVAALAPLSDLASMCKRGLLIGIGAIVISTSATYFLVYLPVYASQTLGLGPIAGFEAALLAGFVLFTLTPIFGAMSDRIGRRGPMFAAAFLMALIVVPLVHTLARRPSANMLFFAVLCLALLKAVYQGSLAGFLAELFPTRLRASGINIAYNISIPIFGGLFPLTQTWLIKTTGDSAAPSLYLATAALLSLASLCLVKSRESP
jgi:MHS family proline/betaine transporter-like MFS transporter